MNPYDFRTADEKEHDRLFELHQDGFCASNCQFCRDEENAILEWTDKELGCPRCGSTEIARDGEREYCARCGK